MALVELRAVAPRIATLSKASTMFLTGDVFAMKVMLGLVASLPIQLNCEALNFTWGTPSISSSGIVGDVSANEVPSFGAVLNMWLAAIRLPAPGIFRAIMFGLPGMCLAIWRATRRA